MSRIEKFEDIKAWQKARELSKEIYLLTNNGGFNKDYSLKDHVRRCSVSVSANIAEGFTRFLYIAKGSCGELRPQIYIALDFNYTEEEKALEISKND